MSTMNTIDSITMLPRTAEAAQLQGREQTMMEHASEQPGLQFQQKTEHQMRQTVETQKSETQEYDGKEGRGGSAGHRTGNRKKKTIEREAPVAPRSNSSFDIMI